MNTSDDDSDNWDSADWSEKYAAFNSNQYVQPNTDSRKRAALGQWPEGSAYPNSSPSIDAESVSHSTIAGHAEAPPPSPHAQVANDNHSTSGSEFSTAYARSGKAYLPHEKQEIVDSYLGWMHVDKIAYRHQRSPTAIFSILTASGIAFYQKIYVDPETADLDKAKIDINRAGFLACKRLSAALATGRSEPLPVSLFHPECSDDTQLGYFYLHELSTAGQRGVIEFIARSMSIHLALTLAQTLRHHQLAYLLALQERNCLAALGALNSDAPNLTAQQSGVRLAIQSYLRRRAIKVISKPIQKWFSHREQAAQSDDEQGEPVSEVVNEFLQLYRECSTTRGFATPLVVTFLVTVLNGTSATSEDSMAVKDLATTLDFDRFVQQLKAVLPVNEDIATDFEKTLFFEVHESTNNAKTDDAATNEIRSTKATSVSVGGSTSSFWVGVVQETNAVLVFDDAVQTGTDTEYWFSLRLGNMRSISKAHGLKSRMTQLTYDDSKVAISEYLKWKDLHLVSFLQEAIGQLEKQIGDIDSRKLETVNRHQVFLRSIGKTGLASASNKSARHRYIANCYRCREGLDSQLNLQCGSCHWLICQCGACGCGYYAAYPPQTGRISY